MQTGVGIGVGAVFRAGSTDLRILQPIALIAPDGTVFTDADGTVLTHGTQRVRPIEESEE
jgi:hypothetical protein